MTLRVVPKRVLPRGLYRPTNLHGGIPSLSPPRAVTQNPAPSSFPVSAPLGPIVHDQSSRQHPPFSLPNTLPHTRSRHLVFQYYHRGLNLKFRRHLVFEFGSALLRTDQNSKCRGFCPRAHFWGCTHCTPILCILGPGFCPGADRTSGQHTTNSNNTSS